MSDRDKPMIEIKRWDNGKVIHSGPFQSVKDCIEDAVRNRISLNRARLDGESLDGARLNWASLNWSSLEGASLNGASLNWASLNWSSLDGASLDGASLKRSSLQGASLQEASLQGASLDRASLNRSSLNWASLDRASLDGASLDEASLDRASLKGATMPDGLTWETYLAETVPALLTAGGKTLAEILSTGCWDCHEWDNCPMAVAFGINEPEDGPPILVPRIREFVQFFDAGLIPNPTKGE